MELQRKQMHGMLNKKIQKVSVIILTYNQMDYLYDAIKSVLNQDYPNIELIVSDDASCNFQKGMLEKFIEENKTDNIKNTIIIVNSSNVGTVKNINGALKKCTGDIIMPLASDDVFYDKTIVSKVVDRFEKTGCQILSCSKQLCDSTLRKKIRLMPHPAYYIFLRKRKTAEKQFHAMAMGQTYEFASGAALYYTKSYIEECSAYDESYLLWEDGPFLARATRNGVQVEMAYDIISILYRDGGISSAKKSNTKSKIYKDYCRINTQEFLAYQARFTKHELRIIEGKQKMIENANEYSLAFRIRYLDVFLYNFYLRCMKGGARLLYKIRKGDWSEI